MTKRGVILVMYDLPVGTLEERKYANKFRRSIKKNGYFEFQKSIYVKLIRDTSGYTREWRMLKGIAPKSGSVNVLPLTLNQFKNMASLADETFDMELFSDDIIAV